MDLYSKMLSNPAALAAFSTNLMLDYMQLWQSSWMKMMGVQAAPVAVPAKGDGRFKDDDWSSNFLFDYIKQSYLITARHIQHAVAGVEGLSPRIGEEGRVLHPPVRRCAVAVQFRAHQSAGAARDGRERRPEPAARA